MSETAKWRHLFLDYCNGKGVDIGFGGDAIVEKAITFDREQTHESHAKLGLDRQDIVGDASNLNMFETDSLDYVYSSHCIEDFENTTEVLKEWLRVIKPGGFLLLLFPDEKRFREVSPIPNYDHKHLDMGLNFMKNAIANTGIELEIMDERELFTSTTDTPDYNCMMVIMKLRPWGDEKL